MKGSNSTTRTEVEEDIKGQAELMAFLVLFRKGVSCVPPLWLAFSVLQNLCQGQRGRKFPSNAQATDVCRNRGRESILFMEGKTGCCFFIIMYSIFSQEEKVIFPEAIKTDDIFYTGSVKSHTRRSGGFCLPHLLRADSHSCGSLLLGASSSCLTCWAFSSQEGRLCELADSI